ncbi:MAG: lysophospholipid acyltransferase family protein [Methylobacter sp.]|nr:lysophospholipid acyltransferase family protein [Methylobacter sp.]
MTLQNTLYPGNKTRIFLGSSIFFICSILAGLIIGAMVLLCTPCPFHVRYKIMNLWTAFILWSTRVFCGIHYEVEGTENINKLQPTIVLSKHQSAWETIALRHILPMQTVLLKRSLLWLPVLGWAMATLKPIAIDRKNQRAALRLLLNQGAASLQQGLWVLIFPEGTRTAPGETRKFNAGGALLAQKTGYPVIPIAHNAGYYWPRYSFLKYPGTIKVRIGPVIESKRRKAADINAEAEAWITQTMKEITMADRP